VVTGSSGGHIFPAVAFLEAIHEKRPDIKAVLVLPEKNIIKKNENVVIKLNMSSCFPLAGA